MTVHITVFIVGIWFVLVGTYLNTKKVSANVPKRVGHRPLPYILQQV